MLTLDATCNFYGSNENFICQLWTLVESCKYFCEDLKGLLKIFDNISDSVGIFVMKPIFIYFISIYFRYSEFAT